MDENLSLDLELSHTALNYLRSCLQGSFASLNMLSQLGHRDFNPDDLATCEGRLEYVDKAYAQLAQGMPVFSKAWKIPQTAEAKEVISLLNAMRNELLTVSSRVDKILSEQHPFENRSNTQFLIACYARYAYTQDNFIRGFIDYGKNFTFPHIVRSYEPLLPDAQRNIEGAHLFFDMFTAEGDPMPLFFKSLIEESIFLPGVFRTNAHDLLKSSIIYRGPLSYTLLEIPLDEAEEWQTIGVNPDLAGYWRAFRFRARNMADWMNVGITSPRLAWFWTCMNFSPEGALPWIRYGFAPPAAQTWASFQFDADSAIDHIRRGFTNPSTAREESKKILEE